MGYLSNSDRRRIRPTFTAISSQRHYTTAHRALGQLQESAFWDGAEAARDDVLVQIEEKVRALPTTRTQSLSTGWDSVSLSDVLTIIETLRGKQNG